MNKIYKRELLSVVEDIANHFPVILITGARQVGKTTLLEQLQKKHKNINYVSLDNPLHRSQANKDPEDFMRFHKTPLIIDEIQYCPELMIYIKIEVDKNRKNGQYFLTGSQSFQSMKGVSESLAGRVAILNMYSLSRREILELESNPYLPKDSLITEERDKEDDVFEYILKGGMPKLWSDNGIDLEKYYSSYIGTYIERDINDIINVKNKLIFADFLSCMAARTSNELNYADIAKDLGIDLKTVKSWTSLLESSGIIYLIRPYYKNTIKKIVKRPKFYFMDTGLCCFLSMWNNAKALAVSAMSGPMFETYIVSEIIKSYINAGINPRNRLFYYRDNNRKEIDLLLVENNTVYPIEIKKGANPSINDIKNFNVLKYFDEDEGQGAVIGTNSYPIRLSDKVNASSFTIIGK